MNDFIRESINQAETGGTGSGGSNISTGTPTGQTQTELSNNESTAANPTPDNPPPPRPPNPKGKEYDRDDKDPLTDSPGVRGSNKKKKRRRGKRDLRRGGFLSALKIDRGSALGGTSKKNPYSIGGM